MDRKNRPPRETDESLAERYEGLGTNPRQNEAERKALGEEIDKRLELKAQTQLSLFINSQIEQGGPVHVC